MGEPERPTLSPEQLRQQQEARGLRLDEIRERASDDTRDLLIRFGRRAGTSGGGLSGGGGPSPVGDLGLFGGRKLDLLRSMGRL